MSSASYEASTGRRTMGPRRTGLAERVSRVTAKEGNRVVGPRSMSTIAVPVASRVNDSSGLGEPSEMAQSWYAPDPASGRPAATSPAERSSPET
jgi:hypothetical protein